MIAGDTLTSIANRYKINPDAILWANNLSDAGDIIAGMELKIPPVSGVVHKVVSGDTISEIARFYKVDADDIVSINNLKNAASIRKGMELMIPGALQKSKTSTLASDKKDTSKPKTLTPIPTPTPNTKPTVVDSTTGLKSRYLIKYTGLSRGFAWGNCTWYVAQNKSVNWRGNANVWMKNAKAA